MAKKAMPGYALMCVINTLCTIERRIFYTGMNSLMMDNASCVLLTQGCVIERRIDSTRTGMNSLMTDASCVY